MRVDGLGQIDKKSPFYRYMYQIEEKKQQTVSKESVGKAENFFPKARQAETKREEKR